MQKVIVFDMAFAKGIIAEGETDGKLIDKHYIKVNGELYNYACVLKDTSEARCAVDLAVKAQQAASDAVTYTNMLNARFLGHYSLNKQ